MGIEQRPGNSFPPPIEQTRKPRDLSSVDTATLRKEFGVALKRNVLKRYPSVSAYSPCIGVHPQNFAKWLFGENSPTPSYMAVFLETLKPEGEDLESLVEPWREIHKRNILIYRENASKMRGIPTLGRPRKEPGNSLGIWVDKVTELHGISIAELGRRINYSNLRAIRLGTSSPDLQTISNFLIYAESSELPAELKEELRNIISDDLERRLSKGMVLRDGPNRNRSAQKSVPCVTYTGGQSGKKLGITRERIRQYREELGIENLLLTETDLIKIEEKLRENERWHAKRGSRKTPAAV